MINWYKMLIKQTLSFFSPRPLNSGLTITASKLLLRTGGLQGKMFSNLLLDQNTLISLPYINSLHQFLLAFFYFSLAMPGNLLVEVFPVDILFSLLAITSWNIFFPSKSTLFNLHFLLNLQFGLSPALRLLSLF